MCQTDYMTSSFLIGAEEVAERLQISRGAVVQRVNRGELVPAATIGKRGTLAFFTSEIDRLAQLETRKKIAHG